jgi:hypothetical protein
MTVKDKNTLNCIVIVSYQSLLESESFFGEFDQKKIPKTVKLIKALLNGATLKKNNKK